MVVCVVAGTISVANDILLFLASDQSMRLYLAFSIFGVGVCCFVCTMHIRLMSVIVICLTTFPSTWMLIELGLPGGRAAGILAPVIASTLVVAMFSYQRDFGRLVSARVQVELLASQNVRLASIDELTGLPNRRYFIEQCRSWHDIHVSDNASLAVGVIDIDGFLTINDYHGHQVGDVVLKEAVKRITSVVPPNSTVCRIGGHEFAVLISDASLLSNLVEIGDRLKAAFDQPISVEHIRAAVGCSVGFACYPDDSKNVEVVFELAEYALRHGGSERFNRCSVFDRNLRQVRASQAALEQSLRRAISQGLLFPVYQPIARCGQGGLIGFECLSRWEDEQFGHVPPDIFIKLAERLGLTQALTTQILTRSLTQVSLWPKHVKISVNISAMDIADAAFMDQLIGLIERSSVSADQIIFEITETAVLTDFAGSQRQLDRARKLGIEIALDDFGTGYSSMSHLQRLSLDKVKIDKMFITGLAKDVASRNIVSGIISLCGKLDIACVAEGVENQDQLRVLQDLGCSYIQGYYISRPVPARDVPALIARLSVYPNQERRVISGKL